LHALFFIIITFRFGKQWKKKNKRFVLFYLDPKTPYAPAQMPRPMKIDYDTGQFVFLRNGTWTPDIPPDYVWSLEKKKSFISYTPNPMCIGFVHVKRVMMVRIKLFFFFSIL
jgi:hypothetical protein